MPRTMPAAPRRVDPRARAWAAAAALLAALAAPGRGVPMPDLPGTDISDSAAAWSAPESAAVPSQRPTAQKGNGWVAPSVEEQLGRDKTLISFGKGALFVPTYTEPRREPEVGVFNARGRQVKGGFPGQRILLDPGNYTVRVGSGSASQRLRYAVDIEEGHTTVLPPTWSGLLVETMRLDSDYVEEQYDLVSMQDWRGYGRGRGAREERLQDVKCWILPPGLYRISKAGEPYSSLSNYLTVQLNPGELTTVEAIFDKQHNLVSGGVKTLSSRALVGRNWTYGFRAGGNVDAARSVSTADVRTQNLQVATDVRLRARYDNTLHLGLNELILQNNVSKPEGKPITVGNDNATVLSTWIRRLNDWVGPYVRAEAKTHLYPTWADYPRARFLDSAGGSPTRIDSGHIRIQPPIVPTSLAEGTGVNLELFNLFSLEAVAQVGAAAHQDIYAHHYVARDESTLVRQASVYSYGLENLFLATVRLGSYLSLDLRSEIFAPNANLLRTQLVDFNADLSLFLTHNLELGYIFDVTEATTSGVKNRFPRTHNVSLRLAVNF